ncbi:MAG TPA: hypothetical protein IAC03_00945 [Candidatus Coprenecus pullistercoris]|nr:hypothetical protein [Candidatus Coprenecus pullistercoris]
MKLKFYPSIIAFAVAGLAVTALTSCNKEPEEQPVEKDAPTLTTETPGPFTSAYTGGKCTIKYTVTNPAEDGQITAEAGLSCDWITDINTDEAGQITFNIARNEGTYREDGVLVSYTYAGAEKPESFYVAVQQDGALDNLTDFTISFEVTPKVHGFIYEATPSDPIAPYICINFNQSLYDSGVTDIQLMEEALRQYDQLYGDDWANYVAVGTTSQEYIDIQPGTVTYIAGFSVDIESATFNSHLSTHKITTLNESPTDATADVKIYYWDLNELAAYNPEYGSLGYPGFNLIVVPDFTLSESAVLVNYGIYNSADIPSSPSDEELLQACFAQGYLANKEVSFNMIYLSADYSWTVLAVAEDEIGNYGEIIRYKFDLPESGISDDFELFDQYFEKAFMSPARAITIEAIQPR